MTTEDGGWGITRTFLIIVNAAHFDKVPAAADSRRCEVCLVQAATPASPHSYICT